MTSVFPNRNKTARAFTLVELLVVIGIIAILAGLLLPALVRTMRGASRTRQAADLNSIGIALEAYKQDFGDYPRPLAGEVGTAFAVLGKALLGPGPINATVSGNFMPQSPYQAGTYSIAGIGTNQQSICVANTTSTPGTAPQWVTMFYTDGAESFGSRVGPNTIDSTGDGIPDQPAGKVYGPYLPSDKFKTHGLAILDSNNNPILYFPASLRKINLDQAGAFYVSSFQPPPALTSLVSGGGPCMYNFDDSGLVAAYYTSEGIASPGSGTPDKALARMQAMMGVPAANMCTGVGQAKGQLVSGKETAATKQPYLLWSLGGDGMFGPREDVMQLANKPGDLDKAIRNCDDVTNFQK